MTNFPHRTYFRPEHSLSASGIDIAAPYVESVGMRTLTIAWSGTAASAVDIISVQVTVIAAVHTHAEIPPRMPGTAVTLNDRLRVRRLAERPEAGGACRGENGGPR